MKYVCKIAAAVAALLLCGLGLAAPAAFAVIPASDGSSSSTAPSLSFATPIVTNTGMAGWETVLIAVAAAALAAAVTAMALRLRFRATLGPQTGATTG